MRRERRLSMEAFEDRRMLAAAFAEFIDPHPAIGNQFGAMVLPLATGNVVITSPYDDAGGHDAGAVYLFSGRTGELISALSGSHANDHVGSGGVTALTNGNFVVLSPDWDSDTVVDASAATWGSGLAGVQGVVSADNSLVGSTTGDGIGIDPSVVNAVTPLSNGNYVVASPSWDNGDATDAGAVTWGNGTTGIRGTVSESNSLVGTGMNDQLGKDGVAALTNGNYVVASPDWNVQTGAATFGDGQVGVHGQVSLMNSLVGSGSGDEIGSTVTPLPNGNYLVRSSSWNGFAGAVTFGNGTTGIVGVVSADNSLVGSSFDFINANGGVRIFSNGNYLVLSPLWNDSRGAVTFGNGTSGISGEVSAANSLVGTTANDQVGSGDVAMLTNGNYVVSSPLWDNGAAADVGAVTFGDGTIGIAGPVTTANSLIGGTAGDQVGRFGSKALTNGNYAVDSPYWSNGSATKSGAVTFGNGMTGIVGVVSAANSLVGSAANDQVGGGGVIIALANGNYVVRSPLWDNGDVQDAGAVTLGDGVHGVAGAVSAMNSLVGSTAGDQVGSSGVAGLANGNYVVKSGLWDDGLVQDVGAVTFGIGASGIVGPVSDLNSLIGSTQGDQIGGGTGFSGVVSLLNGNYVVLSPKWDSGALADVGAVTFGNGTTGISGTVAAGNSLVGSTASDQVGGGMSGSVRRLANGNFVVCSRYWDNGAWQDAGAVTFGDGIKGIDGPIDSTNSVIGGTNNTNLQTIVVDDVNQAFYAAFLADGGGRVAAGSQIDGFAHHWHLAARPTDVDNDGHVAAGDALAVINYINARFSANVAADAALGKPYGFVDVNGDDFVAPSDALDVINAINAGQGGGGEQPVQSSKSKVQSQEPGTAAVDGALMMWLAMDVNGQAGKKK